MIILKTNNSKKHETTFNLNRADSDDFGKCSGQKIQGILFGRTVEYGWFMNYTI